MNMALLQGAVWYDPNANYKPRSAGLAQKKMYKDCLLSLSQRFNTFFFFEEWRHPDTWSDEKSSCLEGQVYAEGGGGGEWARRMASSDPSTLRKNKTRFKYNATCRGNYAALQIEQYQQLSRIDWAVSQVKLVRSPLEFTTNVYWHPTFVSFFVFLYAHFFLYVFS